MQNKRVSLKYIVKKKNCIYGVYMIGAKNYINSTPKLPTINKAKRK